MELSDQLANLVRQFQANASSLEVEPVVRGLMVQYPLHELLQTYTRMSTQYLPDETKYQLAKAPPEKLPELLQQSNLAIVRARYENLAEIMAILQEAEESDLEVRTTAFTTLLQLGAAVETVTTQVASA